MNLYKELVDEAKLEGSHTDVEANVEKWKEAYNQLQKLVEENKDRD